MSLAGGASGFGSPWRSAPGLARRGSNGKATVIKLAKAGKSDAVGTTAATPTEYLHVDPASALPVLPNARDVTSIGHWGTGNLEVPLTSQADLDAVKPFINAAYEGRG
jgi:hypothetical protein